MWSEDSLSDLLIPWYVLLIHMIYRLYSHHKDPSKYDIAVQSNRCLDRCIMYIHKYHLTLIYANTQSSTAIGCLITCFLAIISQRKQISRHKLVCQKEKNEGIETVLLFSQSAVVGWCNPNFHDSSRDKCSHKLVLPEKE